MKRAHFCKLICNSLLTGNFELLSNPFLCKLGACIFVWEPLIYIFLKLKTQVLIGLSTSDNTSDIIYKCSTYRVSLQGLRKSGKGLVFSVLWMSLHFYISHLRNFEHICKICQKETWKEYNKARMPLALPLRAIFYT